MPGRPGGGDEPLAWARQGEMRFVTTRHIVRGCGEYTTPHNFGTCRRLSQCSQLGENGEIHESRRLASKILQVTCAQLRALQLGILAENMPCEISDVLFTAGWVVHESPRALYAHCARHHLRSDIPPNTRSTTGSSSSWQQSAPSSMPKGLRLRVDRCVERVPGDCAMNRLVASC